MKKYGTLENGIMVQAPSAVRIGNSLVCNPVEEHFQVVNVERQKLGLQPYLEIYEVPPETEDGYYAVAVGWERDGDKWKRTYETREVPPPPPRIWTRLSVKGALADAHILSVAEQYLSSIELKPDYSAWKALADCNYVKEGYPTEERWNSILDGAAVALGKTREEVDSFLDMIPTEI